MQRFLGIGITSFLTLCSCGNEVIVQQSPHEGPGEGGSGGDTATSSVATTSSGPSGGSGGAGGAVVAPSVEELRAPDQTTVVVRLSTDVAASLPTAPTAYVITSETVAPLTVDSVGYDPATKSITLTTEKQKLGATYALAIIAPGSSVDGLGGPFVAADTASFWAADFDDPNFSDYEVIADRFQIGQNCVVYLEQGMPSDGIGAAVARFDGEIFPKETSLLHGPSDVDENGRIVLLALDGHDWYGGYFTPVNNLSEEEAQQYGYHSNETDMVYVNVAFGGFDYDHTLPHEFSHLLYHAEHGFTFEDWSWHNEGLAECAVHIVNGGNPTALEMVVTDPYGDIAPGISLVDWQFGNYSQYAMAYLFWTYLAAQTAGGTDGYEPIFDLSGDPGDVGQWIGNHLAKTFAETQRDFLLANWLQEATGPYGHQQMLNWSGERPPTVPGGLTTVELENYAGAYFSLGVSSVDYPGTQGPHILYTGVDASNAVDFDAPFAVGGGVLVVLNTNPDYEQFTPEPSGPNLVPLGPGAPQALPAKPKAVRDPAWRFPPPLDPRHLDRLGAWRERTRAR